MQKQKIATYLFLTILFFFSFSIRSEGFGTGTLVKTSSGYQPIETITVGKFVACLNEKNTICFQPVIAVKKVVTKKSLCIVVNHETILLDSDQKIYLPHENSWINATDIIPNQTSICSHPITQITKLSASIELYQLSIANHHNFFVTHYDVCVHNFVPIIGIVPATSSLFAAFCNTAIGSFVTASIGTSIAGFLLHLAKKKVKKSHNQRYIQPIYTPPSFNDPEKPDFNDDDDDDQPILKVNNMKEFFEHTIFGKELKNYVQKTKHIVQGQTVYKMIKNFIKYDLKKGDLLYLDNMHKDHLEIFDAKKAGKLVLNLTGKINVKKTEKILKRILCW